MSCWSTSQKIKLPEDKCLLEIPRFYFPHKKRKDSSETSNNQNDFIIQTKKNSPLIEKISQLYPNHTLFGRDIFRNITKTIMSLPIYLSKTIFNMLDPGCKGRVSNESICQFVKELCAHESLGEKIFFVLTRGGKRDFLTYGDFQHLLDEIVTHHPGLRFLKTSAHFQRLYTQCVITRIFFRLNPKSSRIRVRSKGTGCSGIEVEEDIITRGQFLRSSFVKKLKFISDVKNVNMELDYFSFEHFYVLNNYFMELDDNSDGYLEREDLGRTGVSKKAVNLIFSGHGRPLWSRKISQMNFRDFVWFCIAEEEKTSNTSIHYWWNIIDLDSRGYITKNYELKYFYNSLLEHMEHLEDDDVARVNFHNWSTQLFDMLNIRGKNVITLADVNNSKMSEIFFNFIFNFNKFMAFEEKHFYVFRSRKNLSAWNHFAKKNFLALTKGEYKSKIKSISTVLLLGLQLLLLVVAVIVSVNFLWRNTNVRGLFSRGVEIDVLNDVDVGNNL